MKENLCKNTYVDKWRVDVVVFFVTPEHYSWVINCNVKKKKNSMKNEVTKLYSAQLVLKAQWKLVYRWSSMLGVSGTVQIG